MTIAEAIRRLQALQMQVADSTEVVFDCPYCQRVIRPVKIELGPPVATLSGAKL